MLATANERGEVKVWDLPSKSVKLLIGGEGKPECLKFSSYGAYLAIGGDRGLRLWEIGSDLEALKSGPGVSVATGMDFSPDGKASGGYRYAS